MTKAQHNYKQAQEILKGLPYKVAKSKALKRQLLRDLSKEITGRSDDYLASITDDNETDMVGLAMSFRAYGKLTDKMRNYAKGLIR